MELRHLRYFVAVAERKHFGRAAEALATAQPSLSRQIAQLEDELGVMLFERTNKRVELTEAGRMFLVDARRTLQSAEASIRHARENAEGTRGELRIGFIGGAMMVELPALLREYRRRYPHVEVTPHAMHYPEHYPALIAGRLDIAWTIPHSDPEIESRIVTSDSLIAVVPADHPLAASERIDMTDFGDEAIVTIAPDQAPILLDTTLEMCLSSGFRPSHIYEVREELTVIGLVAAGFGVAIVPFPWSVIQIPGVVYRPLTIDRGVDETLSWHRGHDTPLVRSFVETAVDVLADLRAARPYRASARGL
jgi:DNA-binding transcriptional LysR family regulator